METKDMIVGEYNGIHSKMIKEKDKILQELTETL